MNDLHLRSPGAGHARQAASFRGTGVVQEADRRHEKQVLREYYAKDDQDDKYERDWGYVNPTAATLWRLRDELVFEAIVNRFDTLGNPPKILEVGVGHGHELAKFAQLGIPPTHLVGVDLMLDRLVWARSRYPGINL